MKKSLTLLLMGMTAAQIVVARQVDEATAQLVARNFIATRGTSATSSSLKLLQSCTVAQPAGAPVQTYYVFGINDREGFVVVAGDDLVQPVLAYSLQGEFQTGQQQSPETGYWMGLYRDQVNYAVQHQLPVLPGVAEAWAKYTGQGGTAQRPTAVVVAPMLTTTWNQGTYYNILTPGTGSTKTPVGCVATAMAQIMKFWDAPTTGTGTYSYNHSTYGQQSANFGATSYRWGLMPRNLTASSAQAFKDEVSLISYHCAVSVRMDFDPSGSGSQVLAWSNNSRCAENAFKNNFGYKNTIEGLYRDEFNDQQWDSLLKNELDNGRPLLYAGFGAMGGHAFVFDGYDDNDMFHINWGWGGMSDGYFVVNSLSPSALGTGGGSGNFNDGQQALIKIEPAQPADTLNLVTNSTLTLSAGTVEAGAPLSLTGNILNRGTYDFGGMLRAGIYRASDSGYVGAIQSINNQVLPGSEDTTMTFSTNALSGVPAGEYFVKIIYQRADASFVQALPDDAGWANRVDLTITGGQQPTAITSIEGAQSLMVYPNPATRELHLDISGFPGKVEDVVLIDFQGRALSNYRMQGTTLEIPVSSVAAGQYALQIVTDKGTVLKKVTVRH